MGIDDRNHIGEQRRFNGNLETKTNWPVSDLEGN